ncbi:GNAT acetyltransferase [Oceanobacillus limi]|uniref:GNAT acetyltransferase n=1 Tax=Oceanobacillus limi TaxID=930131 RepID=A0A1H9YCY4_9BACI|nr:GNAT family N-acetyltransferase [Oceanobacillus limi]SES66683.1 GNAT acetyltransferase [Oceanobacillus limi]
MFALDEREFHRVIPLLREYNHTCPTFAYSVAEKFISGMIYVDDINRPTTILVSTENQVLFIAGNEWNGAFNKQLMEFLYLNQRFTLFSATKEWDHVFHDYLNDQVTPMMRYKFSFHPKKYPQQKKELPQNFLIKEINEETIELTSHFNQKYYNQYWGSVANFLNDGFGYCMLDNGRIISECTSIFRSTSIAEIDIVTEKEYTGNGLAYVLGLYFINKCIEEGLTPSWDCDANNIPSMKLAKKLGFDHAKEYSIFLKK